MPTISLPAEVEANKYVGNIYGYIIEDTNYYNVIGTTPTDGFTDATIIGVVVESKPEQSPEIGVLGYYDNDKLMFVDSEGKQCKIETYTLKLDVFSRNTGILESDMMLKTGAMFIGCGSVGSLAALELAKAGVGRFLLIDNDILGYHNLCRHQCGVKDVGKLKTQALKERILQINPTAKVVMQNMQVQDVRV